MKIKDILKIKGQQVFSIEDEKTLNDAIASLVEHNVGALLVTDKQGNVVGIISERDIMRTGCKHCDKMCDIPIKDVMTRDLIIGEAEDDVKYAESVMTRNRIRHLPIFSGKKLVGIISIGDIVKIQLKESDVENRYLHDYIMGKYPG